MAEIGCPASEKVRCVNTVSSDDRPGTDDAPGPTRRAGLTVPVTSTFSRLNGIVSWEAWQRYDERLVHQ